MMAWQHTWVRDRVRNATGIWTEHKDVSTQERKAARARWKRA